MGDPTRVRFRTVHGHRRAYRIAAAPLAEIFLVPLSLPFAPSGTKARPRAVKTA